MGTSFTLLTTTSKAADVAVAPLLSVAVTSIDIVPTSPLSGVPDNTPVLGSILIQDGNAPPP